MKKFLSDVLIECGLRVDGTTVLGTATATTVATSDNSTNIATTAFVKAQGYLTSETDSQTLSWEAAEKKLTISGGNDVVIDGFLTDSDISSYGFITGSYLPLAGGTMTGGITIENESTPTIKLVDTTNNLQARFRVANTFAYLSVDNPDAVAGSKLILQVDGSEVVTFDSLQNSTFAGNISAASGAFNSGTTNVVSTFTSTDGTATLQCVDSVGNVEFGASGNNFVVQPAGGLAQLTVGATTSTFAGNVGIGTTAPITRLNLGTYTGSRLPYINGTVNTFDANGITVTSYNTANAAIGGGIDLTNNVHSIGSFSPLISFSALTQSGTYNNNYAAIYGILAGDSGDGNWNTGHLVFATTTAYGASEKVRITAAGNVGIGTTLPIGMLSVVNPQSNSNTWTPTNNPDLWISNAGTSNAYYAFGVTTNSGDIFSITNAGNVGIGTTSPAYKLDISGQIRVDNGVGNGSGQALIVGGSGDVTLTSGGSLFFGAYDYGNSTYIRGYDNSAGLYFYADGTLTMNVAGNGNVGIGTTSPSDTLDLYQAANTTAIRLTSAGVGSKIYRLTSQLIGVSNAGFGIQNATDGRYELAIDGSGNVGIGTTSPSEKLHIAGNVQISGGSTSAVLEVSDKAADIAGAAFAIYDAASTYGAVVDYVIYDSDRNNMRTGTFTAVWNTNETNYNDVSTVDIGDTSTVILTSVMNGPDVKLVVTGDASFTIKFNAKIIK